MRKSVRFLLAAWILQLISIPATVYLTYHSACRDPLCTISTQFFPRDFPIYFYYASSAVSIALIVSHLFLLSTWKWRAISFLVNGALAFGAYVSMIVLYLSYGHWHK